MAETPRYQVFISSTYRDLKTARAEVQDAVLRLKHFPIGMELFPATGDTPWELIKEVIAESDYYILIIGGRYGSTDSDGIGFTEKEYDYAKSLDKRILPFVHAKPEDIPRGDTDTDPTAWQKLLAFRDKVRAKHHCNDWNKPDELKGKVIVSLVEEVSRHPMAGWIRNKGIDNEGLLTRLADLQDRYDKQRQELERVKATTSESFEEVHASLDEELTVGVYQKHGGSHVAVTFPLVEVLLAIGPRITGPTTRNDIRGMLTEYCLWRLRNNEVWVNVKRLDAEIDTPSVDFLGVEFSSQNNSYCYRRTATDWSYRLLAIDGVRGKAISAVAASIKN